MIQIYFILILFTFSFLVPNAVFGITASEFADKYKDLIPDDGQLVSILVTVSGTPESQDAEKRAKEIRYLQSSVLKFVSFAGGVNVRTDTWNNEFTAQVHPKVVELLEQRADVISVALLDELSPAKQATYKTSSENISCKENHVLVKKHDNSPACVKPTSVYPLLQRGWASFENTDTSAISLAVAYNFVKSSPTFAYDGMAETLDARVTAVRESFPEQYVIEVDFSTRHGGYGDRTGQILTQVITPHKMNLVVSSGSVVSAIIDEKWDELNQKLWEVHDLPDYDETVTQNSNVFLEGPFSVETNTINYDGSNGFIARPSEDGNFPGIIMIHEWWGLNDNIKEMATLLASHGYVVLAVDLFEGQVATTSTDARQLVSSFDQEKGISNMNSAVKFLTTNYDVEKLGSLGWCFGGGQSLNLALNNNEMDATVIYYGNLVSDQEQLSSISWPVLGIFAELDQGITVDSVNEFESSLNELEIQNEINIYPGVDHAFANPSGKNYAPQETEDAWKKTLLFLETHLK